MNLIISVRVLSWIQVNLKNDVMVTPEVNAGCSSAHARTARVFDLYTGENSRLLS